MQMAETLIAVAIIISFPHTLFLFAVWPNEFLCRCWRRWNLLKMMVISMATLRFSVQEWKNIYLTHHCEFTVGTVFGPMTCSLGLGFFLELVKQVVWPNDLWANRCLCEANRKRANLSGINFFKITELPQICWAQKDVFKGKAQNWKIG